MGRSRLQTLGLNLRGLGDSMDPSDLHCSMIVACLCLYVCLSGGCYICRDREANVAQTGTDSDALRVYVQNPQSSVRRVAFIRLFADGTDDDIVWF